MATAPAPRFGVGDGLPGTVTTVDYHTAGEPFRIVTGGVPPLEGADVPARRAHAARHLDHVRQLLVNEPRGHADMYGCLVTEPDDPGADLGVVFFHNAGYSTTCGHGTIALVTWAVESGRIPASGDRVEVVVDAPSGRLRTVARLSGGRVTGVRFTNVPSFVHATGVAVDVPGGRLQVDIAFGGAFYAVVDAASVDCRVVADDLPRLIDLGRDIKAAIESERDVVHPTADHLRDIYGVIFVDDTRHAGDVMQQRNVAIFADGEVDRSPTGSGVSARLALLDAAGTLPRATDLVSTGVAGLSFVGRVVADADVDGTPAVITEVEGAAYRTGVHEFSLDPRDPLGTGFLLR
ncbi:MAG TPA: proline racemase family protein [Euzebyales bacterium]|nr:proline racemase family protein [Euzebyales bacterium]